MKLSMRGLGKLYKGKVWGLRDFSLQLGTGVLGLLWSAMGVREARHGTDQVLFSCSCSSTRQLPALWLSGVVVALLTGGVVGSRLLVAGDGAGFAAWLGGALFIPSLALASGVWSRTSKLFEASTPRSGTSARCRESRCRRSRAV